VDFRLTPDSEAKDFGAIYFIPFSLYGTVGEWHFTENRAKPATVIDYHWYMSEAHFYRMLYEQVPTFDLQMNNASLEDFQDAPQETWARGAMSFDGKRFGKYPDAELRKDFVLPLSRFRGKHKRNIPDEPPFEIVNPDDPENGYVRYPVEKRKTLRITTENLLLEAGFKTEPGLAQGVLISKHDGDSGYALAISDEGKAVFTVSSGGRHATVGSTAAVNDGNWHHVLAEIDRETGRMAIYVDGKEAGESKASLDADASIDTAADFLVGKSNDDDAYFRGAVDFMRVCQGTLEDAQTDIAELYEWQTNGPWKYDFAGRPVNGPRRDAGALEYQGE
jgi:hypothetical protein